jgi:Spy/CpxP family protein refolding chaperone
MPPFVVDPRGGEMNRKSALICICATALCFAGVQAMAQDKPDQQQPPPSANQPSGQTNPQPSAAPDQAGVSDADVAARVDARLQQLSTELGLSDEQKGQIKPILVDAARRLAAVKNDNERGIESKQSKMDEIHDNARGQIRQFLTPDQSKKLDAMKAADII